MNQQFHILNGDALKMQFPKEWSSNLIVVRECLMEGDVSADTLQEFYLKRATFIGEYFEKIERASYYEITVPEFEKILNITENSEINLWFEDDLFCQVNFWFVASFMLQNDRKYTFFLVRPNHGNEYSFGNMNHEELITSYKNRKALSVSDLTEIDKLWKSYQQNNIEKMIESGEILHEKFPFILAAIKAHNERIPVNGKPGRPFQTLQDIINELHTTNFEPVFREFCKREAIYGYGDLQVKNMLKQISKMN